MTDLQSLALVLVVIYGWECASWVRRGSVAFINFWGGRWRMFHPVIGNQSGGAIFSNPLPPLGSVIVARQLPLSLSPDAILAHVAYSINPAGRPAQSARCVAFADIRSIDADFKKLRINGETFLKLGSPVYAQWLAAQLESLRQLPPARRADAIRDLYRAGFDTARLAQRWSEFAARVKPVRWLANAVFLHLFVLTPAMLWHFGLKPVWPWLLGSLLTLTASTAILYHRRHKTYYPTAGDDRFTHFLVVLLAPATAMRAHDLLSRPLLESFHPLAVAQKFCPENTFKDFARAAWRDVTYPARPLCPVDLPLATACEKFSRELFQSELRSFLTLHKLNLADLSAAPQPAETNCRAYCPRCESQFTSPTGECADCGGIPLVPFNPPN